MQRLCLIVALCACSRVQPGECAPTAPPTSVDASGLVAVPTWPAFPTSAREADETIDKRRTRPISPAVSIDGALVEKASHDLASARAGEDDIAASLNAWMTIDTKAAYLLFGSTHDSAMQLTTFTSLVARMKSLWAVALEQLHGGGGWVGAPIPKDADDEDLANFFVHHDDKTLASLRDRQTRLDYAAWKFGYMPQVIDALMSARGAGVMAVGCDLPNNLRAALPKDTAENAVAHVRELHCTLAMETKLASLTASHLPADFALDDTPPAPRAAFFVGAAHAESSGIPSFLPANARVHSVVFVGGRHPDFADVALAGGRIVALDPLLFKIDAATDVLLLPSTNLPISRVRDQGVVIPASPPATLATPNVFVSSEEPVTFELSGSKLVVGSHVESLSVRASTQVFALRTKGPWIMGQMRVPLGGWTELRWANAILEMTEHDP